MGDSLTRRSFLGVCLASGAAGALGWTGRAAEPSGNETFPGWKPGELDLHFIYTGCGENMFYRLPDGTSVLNDVGEFYRPKSLAEVPLLPSPDRLGGEWVSRYLQRVYPEKEIDYAIFSHWHADHIGHADFTWDKCAEGDWRYRTLPDGRKVDGFLCVAEDFRVRRCYDHQYPNRGAYGSEDSARRLLESWLEAQGEKGPAVEPFKVGAVDQIRMTRDPKRYADFSIRNICANGVIWDGWDGTIDLAGEHVKATGAKSVNQNVLSAAFVIRYGKFSYFATGDLQTQVFRRADGCAVDFETAVGALTGPVTVCKMGHHGCSNAMGGGLLRAVRAQTYVSCMWCPQQAHPESLDRIVATPAADGSRPLILPQLVCLSQRDWAKRRGETLAHLGAVHVVVKVFPGGERYRVYLLDAHDESMRVLATFDRRA